MDLIDILVTYNLAAACCFLLAALILNGIFYYRYLNSECIDSFSVYKKQDLFAGFQYWEAILLLQIGTLPIVREVIIVYISISLILEFTKRNFITIILTHKKIKKINKKIQKSILEGKEPDKNLVGLVEILEKRIERI